MSIDEDFSRNLRTRIAATQPVIDVDTTHVISGARRRRTVRRIATAAMLTAALTIGIVLSPTLWASLGTTAPPAAPAPTATPVLPGADAVVTHGRPVTGTYTGTATIDLGPRPAGVTQMSIALRCLDAGRITSQNGASVVCSQKDVDREGSDPSTSDIIDLEPGQTTMTISAADDIRWWMALSYVTSTATPWATNANGDTYGVANELGSPDLVAVWATNGREGYAYSRELDAARGPLPTSPADALAQQETSPRTASVPVYESDGTTLIGEFILGG